MTKVGGRWCFMGCVANWCAAGWLRMKISAFVALVFACVSLSQHCWLAGPRGMRSVALAPNALLSGKAAIGKMG